VRSSSFSIGAGIFHGTNSGEERRDGLTEKNGAHRQACHPALINDLRQRGLLDDTRSCGASSLAVPFPRRDRTPPAGGSGPRPLPYCFSLFPRLRGDQARIDLRETVRARIFRSPKTNPHPDFQATMHSFVRLNHEKATYNRFLQGAAITGSRGIFRERVKGISGLSADFSRFLGFNSETQRRIDAGRNFESLSIRFLASRVFCVSAVPARQKKKPNG